MKFRTAVISGYLAIWIVLLCLMPTFALAFSASAIPPPWRGQVVGVSDGDTISVMRDGEAVKIRLADVDAPEKHQPFGARAKRFTEDMVFGRLVHVIPQAEDRYHRVVARVVLSDGRDLSEELVRAGFAWHYKRYSKDQRLAEMEVEARKARRGLWSGVEPVPPWEWRKGIGSTSAQ